MGRRKFKPTEVAKMWGISPDKITAWIRAGELRAINMAASARGERPRYLIDEADLKAFEKQREVVATA